MAKENEHADNIVEPMDLTTPLSPAGRGEPMETDSPLGSYVPLGATSESMNAQLFDKPIDQELGPTADLSGEVSTVTAVTPIETDEANRVSLLTTLMSKVNPIFGTPYPALRPGCYYGLSGREEKK